MPAALVKMATMKVVVQVDLGIRNQRLGES
jgi:hypothetical protein